jgi:hypothetical protein
LLDDVARRFAFAETGDAGFAGDGPGRLGQRLLDALRLDFDRQSQLAMLTRFRVQS